MAEDPLVPDRLRIFLAVPLHKIVYPDLFLLLEWLRRNVPEVAWALAEQLHLTLHFLGATAVADIDRIDASMKKIAPDFGPLSLRLSGIEGFPSLERPDILWARVEESSGSLSSLRQGIGLELERLGFKIESRPFCPHVTLGRIKKKTGDLRPLCARIPEKFFTAGKTVGHFVLYQSHCLPEGARYEVLRTYPLSKKS